MGYIEIKMASQSFSLLSLTETNFDSQKSYNK